MPKIPDPPTLPFPSKSQFCVSGDTFANSTRVSTTVRIGKPVKWTIPAVPQNQVLSPPSRRSHPISSAHRHLRDESFRSDLHLTRRCHDPHHSTQPCLGNFMKSSFRFHRRVPTVHSTRRAGNSGGLVHAEAKLWLCAVESN